MITPKNGIVLDPFAGSGSTLLAAKENNFQYVGIEITEEYLPIIQARTGCEIVKLAQKEVSEEIKLEVKNKVEDNTKICPKCGGKIKGKYCEDCLEEYNN